MDNPAAAFQHIATDTLLALDLIGAFVFALSGAIVRVRQRLAIFGVLVLSFAASSAGGIMCDIWVFPLLGAIVGAAICFCLRVLAIHRGWQLPSAHPGSDKD